MPFVDRSSTPPTVSGGGWVGGWCLVETPTLCCAATVPRSFLAWLGTANMMSAEERRKKKCVRLYPSPPARARLAGDEGSPMIVVA